MKRSRSLAGYSLLALCVTAVAVACSSSDDEGSGGSAGSSGTGGASGQAGSGGVAGQAGTGGNAGQAGTGGVAGQAGTGGASGSAGQAGIGGAGGSAPAGALGLTHAGQDIPDASTYAIPDFATDPAAAAVAIFSEQKDRMVITNTGNVDLTITSIAVEDPNGVMEEEFQICSPDSAVHECLTNDVGTLPAGQSSDFYLQFFPIASGERDGTLAIDYTDGTGAHTFTANLVGYGRLGTDELPANLMTSGEQQMHKLWGGYSASQDEAPGPMAVDPAGNMYFAGTGTELISTSDSDRNIFVVKVAADGSLAWQMLYHSTAHDELAQTGDNLLLGASDAMTFGPDGYLYLVGKAANGFNKTLALIMKIDPADGSAVWTRYWFGDKDRLQYTDNAAGYAVDVKGTTIYVVGTGKDGSSMAGIVVSALTTDGDLLWSRLVVPTGQTNVAHRGHTVRADGAGNLYIGGIDYSTGATGPFIAKLEGVTDDGNEMYLAWARTFENESPGSNIDSMDLDAAGNVYLGVDRRGAQTFFSVAKLTPDGNTIVGKTLPGTAGDRNNVYVVRVAGDKLFAGGRIGMAGWDTGKGDGLVARFTTTDMSLDWGSVYFTGLGPNQICEHSTHGLALDGTDLVVMGQVYTGNSNFYRYWGYWYDYPDVDEDYAPSLEDVTGTTTLIDMQNAAFVTSSDNGFDNDGVYDAIEPAMNIEYQDAADKNELTNGAATDGDVFLMKIGIN